jgi:hypothetical protein
MRVSDGTSFDLATADGRSSYGRLRRVFITDVGVLFLSSLRLQKPQQEQILRSGSYRPFAINARPYRPFAINAQKAGHSPVRREEADGEEAEARVSPHRYTTA